MKDKKKSDVYRATFELSREVLTAFIEMAEGLGLLDHDLVLSYAILYTARAHASGEDIRVRAESLAKEPTRQPRQAAQTEVTKVGCRDCGRIIGAGGTSTRCAKCAAEHREREAVRSRSRRRSRQGEGLCIECGWRPKAGKVARCARCNELNNKRSEKYRARKSSAL